MHREERDEMEHFIEHINIIDALAEQISAILDLMAMAGESTDMRSVNSAAEQTLNMFDELMVEIEKIENEWKEQK